MDECCKFIDSKREKRHYQTMKHQIGKLERLQKQKLNQNKGGRSKQHVYHDQTINQTNEITRENISNLNSNNERDHKRNQKRDQGQKWVHNLSSIPLTDAQMKVISRGPNFAILPRNPPVGEYIVSIENACMKLKQGKADELRGEIKTILKKIKTPTNNITKEEKKALVELRKGISKTILTVDKGVSLVVMNKEDYHKKALELLDQSTYKTLAADPTNKYKNKLISLLMTIKSEGGIDETTYKTLYPTGAGTPKFYGLPKVHKAGVPLRPIVSSIGAVSYETSKELSKILKPLVGQSPYHVHNNQEFLHQLQEQKLGPEDIIMSYDVKALFTSVPIQPSIDIITKLLEKDPSLKNRTTMNIRQITSLLEFCLRSTYFTFQNKYYEQIEGTPMGSPISPIVANLYMEDLETKAIQSAPHPPAFWKRFVDDTFVIKSSHKQEFLDHINSIDPNIQFTSEESREDGSMPFLHMLIIPQEDGSFNTTIYRKPTHTDMYLQWNSQHPISSKYSVVDTLHHRARTVCSNTNLLQQEEEHLQKALTTCKYPNWALNRIKMKVRSNPKKKNKSQNKNTMPENYQQPYLVMPYYQGLSESVKRTCSKYGVQVYFK